MIVLLVNVYMPYDVGRAGVELDEYKDILTEIISIIESCTPHYVILAGDFNADMSRNNQQSQALESFVLNENLYMCKDSSHADIPYTSDDKALHLISSRICHNRNWIILMIHFKCLQVI